MKQFAYFLFGVICALFALIAIFNNTFDWYLDDNIIEMLYNEYNKIWDCLTITISSLFILAVLIWIFSLGKSAGELSTEHLLNNQNNE